MPEVGLYAAQLDAYVEGFQISLAVLVTFFAAGWAIKKFRNESR